jgi:hypothetical protein
MSFFETYVISVIIVGTYIGVNYKEIELKMCIRDMLLGKHLPSKTTKIMSIYLSAFIPIHNTFLAILVIMQIIVNFFYKRSKKA